MQGPYTERYDGLQIRIQSKKLKSGMCQVKFYTKGLISEDFYGYALVAGDKSLKEVVGEIKDKVLGVGSLNSFYQQNLYSITKKRRLDDGFVIFKSHRTEG